MGDGRRNEHGECRAQLVGSHRTKIHPVHHRAPPGATPGAPQGRRLMDVVRRYSLLATASLLGLVAMLGAVSTRPSMSATAATRLERGTRYFDSTVVLAR